MGGVLHRAGLDIPEQRIWTSALAPAQFLDAQRPRASAYVIGEAGLTTALRAIGAHSESTLMIGDRMDTDIVAGIEAGLRTVLVLTGISTGASAGLFPYRPDLVLDSIGELIGRTADPFGDGATA